MTKIFPKIQIRHALCILVFAQIFQIKNPNNNWKLAFKNPRSPSTDFWAQKLQIHKQVTFFYTFCTQMFTSNLTKSPKQEITKISFSCKASCHLGMSRTQLATQHCQSSRDSAKKFAATKSALPDSIAESQLLFLPRASHAVRIGSFIHIYGSCDVVAASAAFTLLYTRRMRAPVFTTWLSRRCWLVMPVSRRRSGATRGRTHSLERQHAKKKNKEFLPIRKRGRFIGVCRGAKERNERRRRGRTMLGQADQPAIPFDSYIGLGTVCRVYM